MDEGKMHCPVCDDVLDYDGDWGENVWHCKKCNWVFDAQHVEEYNKRR